MDPSQGRDLSFSKKQTNFIKYLNKNCSENIYPYDKFELSKYRDLFPTNIILSLFDTLAIIISPHVIVLRNTLDRPEFITQEV